MSMPLRGRPMPDITAEAERTFDQRKKGQVWTSFREIMSTLNRDHVLVWISREGDGKKFRFTVAPRLALFTCVTIGPADVSPELQPGFLWEQRAEISIRFQGWDFTAAAPDVPVKTYKIYETKPWPQCGQWKATVTDKLFACLQALQK